VIPINRFSSNGTRKQSTRRRGTAVARQLGGETAHLERAELFVGKAVRPQGPVGQLGRADEDAPTVAMVGETKGGLGDASQQVGLRRWSLAFNTPRLGLRLQALDETSILKLLRTL